MYLFDNPVLQYELVGNLRRGRSFLLLLGYVGLLGAIVYFRWPESTQVDVSNPVQSRRLVDLFFLGQFVLASLLVPSMAAGAFSGEKERKTYEMLLASPLRPGAIILGKLLASLAHVLLLVVASLPIVMLVLPQGGVSLYEVLAAYVALLAGIVTCGFASLAFSAIFSRTVAAISVTMLALLPVLLGGALVWLSLGARSAEARFWVALVVAPLLSVALCLSLYRFVAGKLLQPPDVGSEGREVIDEDAEQKDAVGLVINRDQFPDMLFAPAKRTDLLPDGANPVFDKEMRSEVFSQGTLMMRVVIQVSMFLAIPLMGGFLFLFTAPSWYFAYILLFNLLVAPIFAASTVTSERERATLDLLLVTILTPWQILWGKLLAAVRVSTVLTLFVAFPTWLACALNPDLRPHALLFLAMTGVVLITCLTSATCGLFCSVICRKSSQALMLTYLLLSALYLAPLAAYLMARTSLPGNHELVATSRAALIASPFGAAFSRDLGESEAINVGVSPTAILAPDQPPPPANYNWRFPLGHPGELRWVLPGYVAFSLALDAVLLGAISALFRRRWLVSQ